MTFPTDRDLMEICGLNTDGIAGYRACMAKHGRRTLPPEHLRGPRLRSYERGEDIAQAFRGHRTAAGTARRRSRNAEAAETGARTVLIDAAGHRAERERLLRSIAGVPADAGASRTP